MFIISSDHHLNDNNIESRRSLAQQEIDLAVKNEVDTIINLGDAFDLRKSQSLGVLKAFELINNMYVEAKIKRIFIPGNHDKVDQDSRVSYLDIFQYSPNIKVIDNYEGKPYSNMFKFWYLPYFMEEGVNYLNILEIILNSVKQQKDYKHILFTHIGINGFLNNGRETVYNPIKTELFKPFFKVFVGHYHDRSNNGNIYYIGSVCQNDYSEDKNKGFILLDSEGNHTYHPSVFKQYKSFDMDVDNMAETELTELEIIFNDLKVVAKDSFVRINFYGKQEKLSLINTAKFKNAGIDVKIHLPSIRENVNFVMKEKFEAFNKHTLAKKFKEFILKNRLSEDQVKIGEGYLLKKLEI